MDPLDSVYIFRQFTYSAWKLKNVFVFAIIINLSAILVSAFQFLI